LWLARPATGSAPFFAPASGADMTARIYRPAKTASQSGKAKSDRWLLEYEPGAKRSIDPLMGYTSSGDMMSQVRLWFATQDEALDYAAKNGIAARVEEPKDATRRQVAYADNFKFDRKTPWTH
jgi:hypothetical protein